MSRTLLASLGAFALFMPACGDDGGGEDGSTTNPSTTTPMTTTDPSTGEVPTTGDVPTTGEMTTGDTACTVDICMTYGAAVPKVSSDITDQAAADPMFMADFAPLVAEGPAAVQAFKDSLAAFISDAYGCTAGAYTGPSMEAAHAGLGITQSEYDAFIGLIAGVLASNGVPDADIQNCFAPPLVDPAFASTIIGK
ncbi:MAG: hypothetical protein JNL82_16845 [Myxococcales bacterium]|nr:hypothetical protein [Myxococcales bacterium]